MRTSPALLGLTFALLSASAWAQKVVILEFDGDDRHKLRAQVEAAVKKGGDVELLSIAKYKEAAAKRKLKGGQAMTPAAVARLSKDLGLDAAVEGAVGTSFAVRILDGAGQELWSKELALKKGLLSDAFAKKLAKAIAAAAQNAKKESAPPVADNSQTVADVPKQKEKEEAKDVTPELDLTLRTPESTTNPRRPIEESTEPAGEVHDRDLDEEASGRTRRAGLPVIRLWLSGSTTWRTYCARPGVTSCAEYDAKPEGQIVGSPVVNFSPSAPYLGGLLSAEFFPFMLGKDAIPWPLHGLGLTASALVGTSATEIVSRTAAGQAPPVTAQSVESGWAVGLAYRYLFSFGVTPEKSTGYIGLRGDLRKQTFIVDPNGQSDVPDSLRFFPLVGLDASLPLVRFLRLEASGSFFIRPNPGIDEIAGFGDPGHPSGGGVGFGYTVEGGVAGDVWGPLGYQLRVRATSYKDRFYGPGGKWTTCDDKQCGGAAEETYFVLLWGITASF